jgi:FAD dependent oxidoreductase
MWRFLIVFCAALVAPCNAWAQESNSEIVIYGGTSGGVAAAVQARRMGKSVTLIEPTKFVGGLTTGGLGATDIGNKRCIGGISREFYERIGDYYNEPSHWKQETREAYFKKRQRGGENEKAMWTFEPSVATLVYTQMLADAKISVVFGERLDLKKGVVKEGTNIKKIVMESGRVFSGKAFIDATYEGDLMAKAGVSYHVGREANSKYGETINGLQIVGATHHQFTKKVDPYRKPGDPTSGLLPGVWPAPTGKDGDGDHRIQAYNFRMCTTNSPGNRRAWPKPESYDELRFELLLRNFEAGDMRSPWNPVWMPNRKTDTNNNFAISTDNIGMNYDYPEADYATREKIWKEHETYQKGLMWTIANNPRVPESIRKEFNDIALAKDEFLDNDNWPRQLYVREARRMVSEYVMSEKNCKRQEIVPDSVGMGAYNMDSHNTQRYVTAEGYARNEGDIQIGTRPYPISYRSIRPRETECSNLLVPVCMAASHIAYGSIRMEPVFMVLGQSAATAASLAIDAGTSVQQVDYSKLSARLLADKQVLDFESPPAAAQTKLTKDQLGGIVVDDSEAELKGFESLGQTVSPFIGAGYAHDGNDRKGQQTATFTPNLPAPGKYEVLIAYTPHANRATNVPVTVHYAGGQKKLIVNQQKKPPVRDVLFSLGVFDFAAGRSGSVEIANTGTDGHVIIDAMQWVSQQ